MPIRKLTFGTPEKIVPSRFCKNFAFTPGDVVFPADCIDARPVAGGFRLEFPLAADEHVYGFGLQLKEFDHKGHKVTLRVNADPVKATGDSHAPVPFFVTTRNRGFYLDTARAAEFYCGYPKLHQKAASGGMAGATEDLYAARKQTVETMMSIRIPGAAGVDLYVIEGENLTDVVAQYNRMSGGGCDVPAWGLEPLFRCYYKYGETEILEIARYFREKNIDCGIIGLEPGWQTQTYPCSFVPSRERYPHFEAMIETLRSMHYHVNLWEHCYTHTSSPIYEALYPYAGTYPVWGGLAPDFTQEEASKIFAEHHRDTLVRLGVDGFKLDECDSSDYTGGWSFPNTAEFPCGADGEQMHALLGTLYAQTILRALDGEPTLSSIRSMGALAAPYPFVLYSDLYDHTDFIHGVVNQGFSGLLWSPEVREVGSKKELIRRLQTVVFSVQCLINAWAYEDCYPWKRFDCEDEVRALMHLRTTLIPMLKEAFCRYHETGVPPIRALVMDYTDDPETYAVDDEYLFCGSLLVAPLTADSDTRRVYLPKGTWRDYYTKEPVEPGWHTVTTEQIPVYEKE